MLKANIKKTLLISFSLSFVLGVNTLAAGMPTFKTDIPAVKAGCEGHKGCGHHGRRHDKNHQFLHSAGFILINNYNVNPEEIKKAQEEGKTIFDVAISKGVSPEQLKSLIMAPRVKALDEMAVTGEMSKEKVEELKRKLKEKLDKWDGKFEDSKLIKKIKDNKKKSNKQAE
jgi:hypothetical protein